MEKLRILLVDDQEFYLKTFALGLRSLKKYVLEPIIFTASNQQDALAIINDQALDLVITDGVFPEHLGGYIGDGHGNLFTEDFRGNLVAQAAREKEILVIGVSAEPQFFDNVDLALKKPIDLIELVEKIIELLITNKKGAINVRNTN